MDKNRDDPTVEVLLIKESKNNATITPKKRESVIRTNNGSCNLLDYDRCFPRNSPFFQFTSLCFLVLSSWTAIFLLCARVDIATADLFKFLGLVLTSYLAGVVFKKCHLPPVVGMYLIGILFRNINFYNSIDSIRPVFIAARYAAISVVLTKSGLGLDCNVIKQHPLTVLLLSIVPSTAEVFAVVLFSKFLLPEYYSWLWAILYGYASSAVSSTLTSEILTKFKMKKWYQNDYLSSIYGTSAAIEDIYCISGFAVLASTISNGEGKIENFVFSLAHLFLGFVFGLLWGFISTYFPHRLDKYCPLKRTLMLLFGALCMYFGFKHTGIGPGGPLACFVAGATASHIFKIQEWKHKNDVSTAVSNTWSWVMEPMLFGLVGMEIDLSELELYNTVMTIVLIIAATLVRCLVSYVSLVGNDKFELNEKVFYILSTLPKATVQAALGPQALDVFWSTSEHSKSLNILRTCVLNVIIVTTVSTIILKIFSKKLIVKPRDTQDIENSHI